MGRPRTPILPLLEQSPGALERVRSGYAPDASGCLLWQRSTRPDGYGQTMVAGVMLLPHRVMYAAATGTEPPELDHLCREHACGRVEHLEPVDHRTNVVRGTSPAARHARQETCARGHAFTSTGQRRRCLVCRRDRYAATRPDYKPKPARRREGPPRPALDGRCAGA